MSVGGHSQNFLIQPGPVIKGENTLIINGAVMDSTFTTFKQYEILQLDHKRVTNQLDVLQYEVELLAKARKSLYEKNETQQQLIENLEDELHLTREINDINTALLKDRKKGKLTWLAVGAGAGLIGGILLVN